MLHLDVSFCKSFVLHLDVSAYKSFVLHLDVFTRAYASPVHSVYISFLMQLDVSAYKGFFYEMFSTRYHSVTTISSDPDKKKWLDPELEREI